VLAEELEAAGAAQDEELLRLARALLKETGSPGAVNVSAENHSVAVGGNVGGSVTITHRET